jgi:hypothetical protein
VEVSGREVTLSGQVDSRMAKRRAEDIAESVSGVTHVQNNLRVRSSGEGSAMSGSAMSQAGGSAGSSSGMSAGSATRRRGSSD